MTTLSAALLLPRGMRHNMLLASPETDVLAVSSQSQSQSQSQSNNCSASSLSLSPLHKKMRFRRRRRRSSSNSSEEIAAATTTGTTTNTNVELSLPLPLPLPSLPITTLFSSSASAAASASASSSSIMKSNKKKKLRLLLQQQQATSATASTTLQVLEWVETTCPHDVIPKILAFCGPQTAWKLYRGNRFWHTVLSCDETWRVLCEELYKWKEGEPEPECSWREFYSQNPCVPVDYSTVPRALKAISEVDSAHAKEKQEQESETVVAHEKEEEQLPERTIWLRAQEHRVSETVLIEAVHANITLESMATTTTTSTKKKKRQPPLAALLLQTRRRNKPLIHIAAGHVTLKNLRLGHYCGGFNLWSGQACVQVSPLPVSAEDALREDPSALPTATVQHCEIVSHSGRGIVVNDGGDSHISHSYIHDCAATGIYVGSHRCHLTLEHSDLIANGHGNQLAMSVRTNGITRGHSGFYLENGNATLTECNISNNSSCGITVSSTESNLVLDHSDVVANGQGGQTNQVEVALGSRQLGSHNTIARTGLVKVRSQLGFQSCIGKNSGRNRKRTSSVGSSSSSTNGSTSGSTAAEQQQHRDIIPLSEQVVDYDGHDNDDDDDDVEDDLEHLQGSFVVAEENVRFGELIEI